MSTTVQSRRNVVRTVAWMSLLSDSGWVVRTLTALHLLPDGSRLLATPVAVVMGLTYNFLPFMVLPLYASLERLDTRLLDAAGDLYASAWTTFRKVTWPLSLPGVISGTLLFWGSVLALGSRHYIRDGLISVALSLLTFYGFYLGLGIALPAGLLEGIL